MTLPRTLTSLMAAPLGFVTVCRLEKKSEQEVTLGTVRLPRLVSLSHRNCTSLLQVITSRFRTVGSSGKRAQSLPVTPDCITVQLKQGRADHCDWTTLQLALTSAVVRAASSRLQNVYNLGEKACSQASLRRLHVKGLSVCRAQLVSKSANSQLRPIMVRCSKHIAV